MTPKVTFFLIVLIVMLISFVAACLRIHQIVNFDGNAIDYYREGVIDARLDLCNGTMRLKDSATDALEDRYFKDGLQSECGIGRDRLVFETITIHVAEYARGYNEVTEPAIERSLGASKILDARNRARE